ncbi:MAG: zinc-binding dehydrogenase [Dehalococcoidia bacterium]
MKGRAAVLTKQGSPMEMWELPLPEVEPGAILIKVRLANICGSDLHYWRGDAEWRVVPSIMGHEMTGEVFRLGKGVSTDSMGQPLSEGDRVVYPYFFPCERCPACLSGNRAACLNNRERWRIPCDQFPHFIGAYAEYYYLPPRHTVFKVPDELRDEMVSPLNCALAEVMYGLYKVGVSVGDTVVLQGAGGLGIYATAVAREMGASQVIVIDRFQDRLELAKAFGAHHVISMEEYPSSRERIARVRELTGGRVADVVADLAGFPQVVPEGLSMVKVGGSYLLIGNISRGLMAEIDPSLIVSFSRRLVGVVTYEPWVVPRALDFLKANREKYPFHRLISHKFPLEQINEAFALADQGKVSRAALVP